MKYYICEFSKNWSDEFEVSGCDFYDENEKIEHEVFFEENADKFMSIWFGTNEGWEDVKVSDFKESYIFTKIEVATYLELKSKFKCGFGTFFSHKELGESIGEYEE